MSPIRLDDLLHDMVERNSSDLFLKAGAPPFVRVDGLIQPLDYGEFSVEDVQELAYGLMARITSYNVCYTKLLRL